MTREQNPTVQLPRERLLQLKEVAAALGGTTMSAAVGYLIRRAQDDGLIDRHLPGVVVTREDDTVHIAIKEGWSVPLPVEEAHALALALRDFATGEMKGVLTDPHEDFRIERRGNGLKLTLPFTQGPTQTYSVDVALDLADLIDRAAGTLP